MVAGVAPRRSGRREGAREQVGVPGQHPLAVALPAPRRRQRELGRIQELLRQPFWEAQGRLGAGRPLTVCCASSKNKRQGSAATSGGVAAGRTRPKVVVFDLDGCVWHPDMYMLWGGGAPFEAGPNGTLSDRNGRPVTLHSGVRGLMKELVEDAAWQGVIVAAASCCDEPAWAHECLKTFEVEAGGRRLKLDDIVTVQRIHKGNKVKHFEEIRQATGCDFQDMVFFDNEPYNCDNVVTLGVTCIYCPGGVTPQVWRRALEVFPCPGQVTKA